MQITKYKNDKEFWEVTPYIWYKFPDVSEESVSSGPIRKSGSSNSICPLPGGFFHNLLLRHEAESSIFPFRLAFYIHSPFYDS
jgi:hypothetical protein